MEGPRCDSTEWVWGIFLAVGISSSSMAVEALTAWAVLPALCSGGGIWGQESDFEMTGGTGLQSQG